jgi:membrane protein DedA with SNARE-associated domain
MSSLLALLIQYKYFILFPVIVIEGPFATIISGFLISLGTFNVFIAYPIIILGDLASDSIFYFIGRFGSKSINRWMLYFGVTAEKLENAKTYFTKNSNKAIVTSKFVHGVGVSGLMAAGLLKIPYFKYARVCLITDVLQFGVLLIIGFFFGHAYKQIAVYLDNYAKIMSIIAVVIVLLVIIIYKFRKRGNNLKSYAAPE